MFTSIRFILILSIVLILGTTFFFGWYYKSSSNEIIRTQIEKGNESFANSYVNSIWADYGKAIEVFSQIAPNERVEYLEFDQISNKTAEFIKNTPIIKLNIYSTDGKIFLTTDHNIKKASTSDADKYLRNAHTSNLIDPLSTMRSMETSSETIFDADFYNHIGALTSGDVVRSLVPIKGKNGAKGLIEIYVEVTDATSKIRDTQYIGIIITIGTFLALISLLVYTTRRAEKIIEKQYEMNAELNTAKAKAESDNEEKSKFLASISHELRTPLNAIIGFSEIIKDEVLGALGNEQYKNYVSDIHSQGVHLLSLINDILDYSKAEAGKLEMEYEEIDLHKLIANCLRTQEPRAGEGKVKLLRELPTEHIVMSTDAKRLKQVLLNLLSNAVKFTPEEGQVKISAWENVTDGKIGIEISDSGIGISPKDLARALSPFGQVDSELSRRYEGTGLGLPLTKKFVELLGGHMEIDSEVGKGTKVTVFLPPSNTVENDRKDKYQGVDPVAKMKAEQRQKEEENKPYEIDYNLDDIEDEKDSTTN